MKKKWFAINQAENAPAEVLIYDEIGGWGVTAKSFLEELSRIKGNSIALHINSPGGDVFEAFAIFDKLRQHPAKIVVYVCQATSEIDPLATRRIDPPVVIGL